MLRLELRLLQSLVVSLPLGSLYVLDECGVAGSASDGVLAIASC